MAPTGGISALPLRSPRYAGNVRDEHATEYDDRVHEKLHIRDTFYLQQRSSFNGTRRKVPPGNLDSCATKVATELVCAAIPLGTMTPW
jgi:hypothetical protein